MENVLQQIKYTDNQQHFYQYMMSKVIHIFLMTMNVMTMRMLKLLVSISYQLSAMKTEIRLI